MTEPDTAEVRKPPPHFLQEESQERNRDTVPSSPPVSPSSSCWPCYRQVCYPEGSASEHWGWRGEASVGKSVTWPPTPPPSTCLMASQAPLTEESKAAPSLGNPTVITPKNKGGPRLKAAEEGLADAGLCARLVGHSGRVRALPISQAVVLPTLGVTGPTAEL